MEDIIIEVTAKQTETVAHQESAATNMEAINVFSLFFMDNLSL